MTDNHHISEMGLQDLLSHVRVLADRLQVDSTGTLVSHLCLVGKSNDAIVAAEDLQSMDEEHVSFLEEQVGSESPLRGLARLNGWFFDIKAKSQMAISYAQVCTPT